MQTPERDWVELDQSILPTPWSLATLPAEQAEKLKEFREKAKEYLTDEHEILGLRWLRARDWDVDKAVELYINHRKWRKRMQVDKLLEEYPNSPYFKVLRENYPLSITDSNTPHILRTRDGHHFAIEKLGSISPDLAGMFPLEELVRFHVWGNEVAAQQRLAIMKELGGEVFAPTFAIEDLAGVSLAHLKGPTMGVLKEFAKLDSENYPEGLRKVIIVNVPGIFSMIWKGIQYFFDSRQKAKFEFISQGTDFHPILAKYVHPDYIPKSYGGNLDWDVPKPTLTDEVKNSIPTPVKKKYDKVHIGRGSSHEHLIEVTEIGTSLEWEFHSDSYDVGFGLKYKIGHDSTHEELAVIERVDSHKSTVYGTWIAEKTGHYVLVWDNTYSWAHGKEVKYHVKSMSPSMMRREQCSSGSDASSKSGKGKKKKAK